MKLKSKSIKRRFAFQFTFQYITLVLFIFVVLVIFLLIFLRFIALSEIHSNYPIGVLESIHTETSIADGKVEFSTDWHRELAKKNMWLQIVNFDGEVMYAINTPSHVNDKYTINDLVQIEEANQYETYKVYYKYDATFFDDPYLFLLGYEDKNLELLESWVNQFTSNEALAKEAKFHLEKVLAEMGGYLQILNNDGEIVQSIGHKDDAQTYKPLDVLGRKLQPGNYETDAIIYHDNKWDTIWMLHLNKKEDEVIQLIFIKKAILTLVIMGGVLLSLAIALTGWHAFRYGQPLHIFISWLERMGHDEYTQVFTDKERQKIFNKKGKVRYRYRLYQEVIQAFYDVTEKLSESLRERKRLEKVREEWMTGISHDLRTPLSTIQGYGHILESGEYEWSSNELQEVGAMVREKGDYMLNLIQDFSLVFQLKNDTLPLKLEPINIVEIIEHTLKKFSKDVTLGQNIINGKYSQLNIEILGDRKWLLRMLDNLIYNAIKHNPPGISIVVKVEKKLNETFVQIIDNGQGMDEETKQNLFERYYRGTNTDEQIEGVGLGMSIAKEIVNSHHGEIKVESTVEVGTKITLIFPIYPNE
ncbi:HAMP domain-containing sensor histidine kinase [Bacillus sp. SM2101]|uniref:sensor histidine kinase n=1 Tax=Bacillus sp. SM2101 TaxID=2805366 RepID=UPI001BDF42DC|nr:HAMP domain-containing sensor histidine kinase [Bacillus sp. SM2101]